MSSRICLVHYHEIGLKGRNRSDFERTLRANVDETLEGLPAKKATRVSGHEVVEVTDASRIDEIAGRIARTPGVVRVSIGYRTSRDPEEYLPLAAEAFAECDTTGTFKVAGRRSNTDFPLTSMDLNQQVGAYLCEAFPDAIVKMKDPDTTVHAHVIQGSMYIYARSIIGVGGLPVGSAGRVVSLLSSGIDSPVATWRMLKRGARVLPIHFSGRPQTADTSEFLVQDIVEQLDMGSGIPKLYIVPFGDHQKEISLAVPASMRVIMYRRIMFSVAERIARSENAKALVTGESLGQVASQTLDNIAAVDGIVEMPVLRPLIGHDKTEIIAEAKELGTFDISTMHADDCCTLFMPKNPETHAAAAAVEEAWNGFDHEKMIEDILDSVEVIRYI